MSGKKGSKLIPKATASSDILYLVGIRESFFDPGKVWKKSGNIDSVSVATML